MFCIIQDCFLLYTWWFHRYKHIGVVTASLIVKNMVKDDEHEASSSTVGSESERSMAVQEAENLLSLVMSSTANSPVASALFMDELANISLREKMNSKLEVLVESTLLVNHSNLYVINIFKV